MVLRLKNDVQLGIAARHYANSLAKRHIPKIVSAGNELGTKQVANVIQPYVDNLYTICDTVLAIGDATDGKTLKQVRSELRQATENVSSLTVDTVRRIQAMADRIQSGEKYDDLKIALMVVKNEYADADTFFAASFTRKSEQIEELENASTTMNQLASLIRAEDTLSNAVLVEAIKTGALKNFNKLENGVERARNEQDKRKRIAQNVKGYVETRVAEYVKTVTIAAVESRFEANDSLNAYKNGQLKNTVTKFLTATIRGMGGSINGILEQLVYTTLKERSENERR